MNTSSAYGFCFMTSAAFVGSLHTLVPKHVRALDRNDPRQIKWRSFATGFVCIGALIGRTYLLSDHEKLAVMPSPSDLTISLSQTLSASAKALFHVGTLYTGPILQGITCVAAYMKHHSSFSAPEYFKSLYAYHIEPTMRSLSFKDDKGWESWRNLIIAPLMEEVAFRTCMIPILVASGLSESAVCWTAPLFFGIAHAHHATHRIRQGTRPATVAIQTLFQFAYTTLFGAYASFVFMRTHSTMAIVLTHGFCNWMGLPNFLFIQKQHLLYDYRRELLLAHLLGCVCFGAGLLGGLFASP